MAIQHLSAGHGGLPAGAEIRHTQSARLGAWFNWGLIAAISVIVIIAAILIIRSVPDALTDEMVVQPAGAGGHFLYCRSAGELSRLNTADYTTALNAIGDESYGCQWVDGRPIKYLRFKGDGMVEFTLNDPGLDGTRWNDGHWYTWRGNLMRPNGTQE